MDGVLDYVGCLHVQNQKSTERLRCSLPCSNLSRCSFRMALQTRVRCSSMQFGKAIFLITSRSASLRTFTVTVKSRHFTVVQLLLQRPVFSDEISLYWSGVIEYEDAKVESHHDSLTTPIQLRSSLPYPWSKQRGGKIGIALKLYQYVSLFSSDLPDL